MKKPKRTVNKSTMSLPPNMDAPPGEKRWVVVERYTNAVLTHVFARLWFDARKAASLKLCRPPEDFTVREAR